VCPSIRSRPRQRPIAAVQPRAINRFPTHKAGLPGRTPTQRPRLPGNFACSPNAPRIEMPIIYHLSFTETRSTRRGTENPDASVKSPCPPLREVLRSVRQPRTCAESLERAADPAGGRPWRIGRCRLAARSTTPGILGPPHPEDFRGGSSSLCLRRRHEDCLPYHRSPSRRSDSQTPGESGVPRPGPVRAARSTAGRRQFLAMNSNEGRWSIRLISIPSFGRSLCVPVGRPMSHESAGEREYFRREVP